MAIEKIKKATKTTKRKPVEKVAPAPNLEEKRKQFQQEVVVKQPVKAAGPKHHSASKRTLMIIVGALLAVVGTTVIVYAYFWYQSPEKVVMDAVMNSISAKSTSYKGDVYLLGSKQPQINYSGAFGSGLSKLDVALSTPLEGELSKLDASVVAGKKDLYLKIDKISKLIERVAPTAMKESLQPHLPLIRDEVDGKWIKVNQNDIDLYAPVTHVSRCTFAIFQRMTTGDGSAQTLGGMYRQYPFFKVTESTQPTDTVGKYKLTLDTALYDKFRDRLYGSEFYASLAACSKAEHDIKASDIKDIVIDLTINKGSREVTDVLVSQGTSYTSKLTLQPTFNGPVSVQVPKDVASVNDLKAQAFRDYVKNTLKPAQ